MADDRTSMANDYSLLRSWLFVPGDFERKLAKCWSSGADALIVDLKDSVASPNKAAARVITREAIATAQCAPRWWPSASMRLTPT